MMISSWSHNEQPCTCVIVMVASKNRAVVRIYSQYRHFYVVRTDTLWAIVQPVSHQPCGSRAPISDNKFLRFVRQPQGVVYYTARLSYDKQGRKAAATSKNKFSTCSFSLRFVCVF